MRQILPVGRGDSRDSPRELLVMRMHAKGLAFLLLSLLVQGAGYAQESHNADAVIPIPGAAYNIQRYKLVSESAYQVDFEIDVSYPDSSVVDFYLHALKNKGWSTCEHDDTSWIEYENASDDAVRLVRQKLEYLFSKEKSRLILVALRYYGYQVDDTVESWQWNEEVQHVSVVLYHLRSGDIRKTLSLLSVNCDGVPVNHHSR